MVPNNAKTPLLRGFYEHFAVNLLSVCWFRAAEISKSHVFCGSFTVANIHTIHTCFTKYAEVYGRIVGLKDFIWGGKDQYQHPLWFPRRK